MVSAANFYKGDPQSFKQGEEDWWRGYKQFDTWNCKLSAFVPKSNLNSKVFSECTVPFVFFFVKESIRWGRGWGRDGDDDDVCYVRVGYIGIWWLCIFFFLGLNVEKHLQLIGYFLELLFVVCWICSGPVRWRFRKTGRRWSLTELGARIEKPISRWWCSIGAWFGRGIRVRTGATRLDTSWWTIASSSTWIRNGNGLSRRCSAGPVGCCSRIGLAWNGHVLYGIARRTRASTASPSNSTVKATLGSNHDSHHFYLDFIQQTANKYFSLLVPNRPQLVMRSHKNKTKKA